MREGVTNVIRHSHAHSCAIRLARDAREVRVEIGDDGARLSAASPADASAGQTHGNGLRGLAERVAALGGTCESGPDAEGGFRLRVRLPRERDAPGEREPATRPPASVPLAASPAATERADGRAQAESSP